MLDSLLRQYRYIHTDFLSKILIDKSLDKFYEVIERKVKNECGVICSYRQDEYFITTSRNVKSKDKPFLWHLSKVRMQDKTLKKLRDFFGIDIKILKKIQDSGFTIKRTGDPLKRKNLSLVLNEFNIRLQG